MEPHSVLLRGIARVLNAGGSALVDMYDAATSIKTSVVPGETGKLKAKLGEYEKKIERLYYQIGKEVALRENVTQMPAAAEAGIKLVAEHRVIMERIKQRIREIEDTEKAATKAAAAPAGGKAEPAAEAGGPAPSVTPVTGEVSTGVVAEEVQASVAEATEMQTRGIDSNAAESTEPDAVGAPVTGEGSTGVVTEEVQASVAETTETQTPEIDTKAAESAEPDAGEVSGVTAAEEITDTPAEAEPPAQTLQTETSKSGVTVAGEPSPVSETKQEAVPAVLETMLKGELLQICVDKGIDADHRMTKAAIIELIKKKRI